jgi:Family of unknown function (DUF6272)
MLSEYRNSFLEKYHFPRSFHKSSNILLWAVRLMLKKSSVASEGNSRHLEKKSAHLHKLPVEFDSTHYRLLPLPIMLDCILFCFLYFSPNFSNRFMTAEDILTHYTRAKETHILMMFKGGLSQNIVVDLGSLLQNRLGFDIKVRKMFGIFVELAQNIKNYSAETERASDGTDIGVGILLLADTGSHYTVNSGNLIRIADAERLEVECKHLLSLDKAGLKAYHEERIDGDAPEGSKGAGLGLIEITLKSGGNVHFEFLPHSDEFRFLSITATVEK